MLFYFFIFLIPCIWAVGAILSAIFKSQDALLAAFTAGTFIGVVPSLIALAVWSSHAEDLGTIKAQQEVVAVYESEVAELNKKLADFEYPKGALLNADSPVASIVASISVWQNKLAEARAEEAEAKKSIEQRRYSYMSGVIGFVGDYK